MNNYCGFFNYKVLLKHPTKNCGDCKKYEKCAEEAQTIINRYAEERN